VLTGGDRAKMGKEWAGLQAKASELRGRKAYVTPWNRVYRLVTGPFPSDAAAQEFVAKLRHRCGRLPVRQPGGQVDGRRWRASRDRMEAMGWRWGGRGRLARRLSTTFARLVEFCPRLG
jgi:hypothetical protein